MEKTALQGHCNFLDESGSPCSTLPPPGGPLQPCVGDLSPSAQQADRASLGRTSERRLLPSGPPGLQRALSHDSLSVKYKRMKCAVIVMATLMIIASMLLVGVSLAMAEHIDELGRRRA